MKYEDMNTDIGHILYDQNSNVMNENTADVELNVNGFT